MGDLSFVPGAKRDEEARLGKSELIDLCIRPGHIPSRRGSPFGKLGEVRVNNECQRCHAIYSRSPTSEETETYMQIVMFIETLRKYNRNP